MKVLRYSVLIEYYARPGNNLEWRVNKSVETITDNLRSKVCRLGDIGIKAI